MSTKVPVRAPVVTWMLFDVAVKRLHAADDEDLVDVVLGV
jgi:hypothetical protein